MFHRTTSTEMHEDFQKLKAQGSLTLDPGLFNPRSSLFLVEDIPSLSVVLLLILLLAIVAVTTTRFTVPTSDAKRVVHSHCDHRGLIRIPRASSARFFECCDRFGLGSAVAAERSVVRLDFQPWSLEGLFLRRACGRLSELTYRSKFQHR